MTAWAPLPGRTLVHLGPAAFLCARNTNKSRIALDSIPFVHQFCNYLIIIHHLWTVWGTEFSKGDHNLPYWSFLTGGDGQGEALTKSRSVYGAKQSWRWESCVSPAFYPNQYFLLNQTNEELAAVISGIPLVRSPPWYFCNGQHSTTRPQALTLTSTQRRAHKHTAPLCRLNWRALEVKATWSCTAFCTVASERSLTHVWWAPNLPWLSTLVRSCHAVMEAQLSGHQRGLLGATSSRDGPSSASHTQLLGEGGL